MLRQHSHPAGSGMDALQQLVERERRPLGYDQLSVEHEARGVELQQGVVHFRKVAA